jgi:hypothetical protein
MRPTLFYKIISNFSTIATLVAIWCSLQISAESFQKCHLASGLDADHDPLLPRSRSETGQVSFQEFPWETGTATVISQEGMSRRGGWRAGGKRRRFAYEHQVSLVLQDGGGGGDEHARRLARARQALRLLRVPLPYGRVPTVARASAQAQVVRRTSPSSRSTRQPRFARAVRQVLFRNRPIVLVVSYYRDYGDQSGGILFQHYNI